MKTGIILGTCLGALAFAGCSSDENTANLKPDGSVGSGGSSSGGTGGAGTGGARTGGAAGTATGGSATGGVGGNATGGVGGSATGGVDGGATGGAGATGTGGTGTGGTPADGGGADAGDACATLAVCCGTLTGRFAAACDKTASSANGRSCAAAHDLFCGGNPAPDGGATADAGGGCTALDACCASSNRRVQCERLVANGNDATCNQVAPFLCN